ncbi:helix-turn-helix domain-containing protein [Streptomyces sp. NPDC048419]|uniref:helix-turn-helix domain-containing protein n=1 Tax=Streptomyces sp. NPDC048419 TaxID=3365547 RepID=UPI00371C89EA
MTPERARLAAALRELRAATGLSMADLAAKTAFSKSSWERYLNGKTLPPRQAVEELCRLAGEPDGRCLALWEIAEAEWSGRGREAARTKPPARVPAPAESRDLPQDAPQDTPPDSPSDTPQDRPRVTRTGHRGAVLVAVLASVCAVAVGGVTVALLLLPGHGHDPRPPSAPEASAGPRCRGASCEGGSPMEMHCAASPDTLATRHTHSGAWLEVRYSKACGTSWARMWGTRVGDRLRVTAGGRTRGAEIGNGVDADSFVYTPMTVTPRGTVLRICFDPAKGAEECFSSVPR